MSGGAGQADLADRPAGARIGLPQDLASGFRTYERFEAHLPGPDGTPRTETRDVLRGGRTIAVLAVDPDRGETVLLRQFRLPAELATGHGDMVEIVAGHVEDGESLEEAAIRECGEEIGLTPSVLVPVLSFMASPGITDEYATLFLARVECGRLPDMAGATEEAEHTRPFAVGVDAAIAALADGRMANGYLLIALQWLALNRARLPELLGRD